MTRIPTETRNYQDLLILEIRLNPHGQAFWTSELLFYFTGNKRWESRFAATWVHDSGMVFQLCGDDG
jgi:hypothetical protein